MCLSTMRDCCCIALKRDTKRSLPAFLDGGVNDSFYADVVRSFVFDVPRVLKDCCKSAMHQRVQIVQRDSG